MKPTFSISAPRSLPALVAAGAFAFATSILANPVPSNLGGGLDVLVRAHLAQQQAAVAAPARSAKGVDAKRPTVDPQLLQDAQSYMDSAITSDDGMIKVYIYLSPEAKASGAMPEAVLPASARLTGKDMNFRAGMLEALVDVDDVPALARDRRVASISLAIKPILDVGAATTQGVHQHRVDQINSGGMPYDGTGITVGAMSDTFNRTTGAIKADTDVATGDLPGPGNPLNTTPVAVLDDPGAGTNSDEGRAMLQIIHDMAPKARLGFATASVGQASFADNIRSLAGLSGATHALPGFRADVIVDDLFYSDEPMFGNGIIGAAVNEVAAAGISYFSSAGNRPAAQAYFSDFRPVPNDANATAGTNINLTGVSAALYAGGFHNFRSDGGQDIAQTITVTIPGQASSMAFQWDEPFNKIIPGTQFFSQSGNFTGTTTDILIGLTAGVPTRIAVTAPVPSQYDAIVTVLDPSNNTIVNAQDTGTDETVFFTPTVTGNYTVRLTAFAGTTGAYLVQAFANSSPALVADYNLLFFRSDTGAFIKSIASNNISSNQPFEFGTLTFPTGQNTIQLVIARATATSGQSTKLRYVCTGFAGPLEYFDYQTPVMYGHNHEPGCIAAAAYSPFRPFVPEDFTSPGPSYIYFDGNGDRLTAPVIRQKPDVAAMDGGNNTFFSGDSASDADTLPNFYGTSAAAPHAASIAALVLQAHGGTGMVTQPQMRTILQRAGFNHDLDPFFATGVARGAVSKLTLTARANHGNFNLNDGRTLSTIDTRMMGVSYVGSGSVNSLSINLQNGNTTGGTEANVVPGLLWDNRAYTISAAASGFPFTVGQTTGTLTAANITGTYSLPAPAPAVAGQNYQLDIAFAAGTFTSSSAFTFGADRDELRTAANPAAGPTGGTSAFGNSADLFGATVSIPEGTTSAGGATFSATLSTAEVITGTFVNKIGKGYSPLDGFGFINAQDAVAQPLP